MVERFAIVATKKISFACGLAIHAGLTSVRVMKELLATTAKAQAQPVLDLQTLTQGSRPRISQTCLISFSRNV